jgi:hypothetical protein
MKIILHAGVHATDEDRLMKCLLKNAGDLAGSNVAVPGPSRYRALLRDTLNAMVQGNLAPDAREVLLEAILDGDHPERLIFSNENFFSVPKSAVGDGLFYPGAEEKLARMCHLFAPDEIELFIGLRNPAGFLCGVHALSPDMPFDAFMNGSNPATMRWSELVLRIRDALPDLPITLWANEDTPLIWAELLREMLGLAPGEKIQGGFDLITELMSADGMRRFRAYLKAHPVMTEDQKRRVISAFLAKFALPEMLEEELDIPGWTADDVDRMVLQYERDIAQLADVPGVRMIMP